MFYKIKLVKDLNMQQLKKLVEQQNINNISDEPPQQNEIVPFKKKHKSMKMLNVKNNTQLTLMALPGIIIVFIFAYIPMQGAIMAFQDFKIDKGVLGSPFVGLKNFEFLFATDAFRITSNTLILNSLFIIIGLVVSLIIALLMYEVGKSVRVYQTVLFVPYFLSWVVVGYVFYTFLNVDHGLLNQLLSQFGVKQINWYAQPAYWPIILTIVNTWKSAGFFSVLYFAGLLGIDLTYFEAAELDGATKLQKIRYISLPFISPIVTVMLLMQIGKIFSSDIGLYINMTRQAGELFPTTDVIDTFVYRGLTHLGDVGMTTAASFYQSITGLVLVFAANYIIKKVNPESALF